MKMRNAFSGISLVLLLIVMMGCGKSGDNGVSPDTTPPADAGILINNGAGYTQTPNVSLTLAVSDNVSATADIEMMISNDADFSETPGWEPFTASKSWTLISGDGEKTVYVKFRDAAGNETASVSDTINLYETTPLILFSPDPAYVSAGNTVKVEVRAANVVNLGSFQGAFSFDPKKVEVTELEVDFPVSLLASTGANIVVSDQDFDNEAGLVKFGALAQQEGFTGVSEDGPIATVTFKAKVADPTSEIAFGIVKLYDYPPDEPLAPISGVVAIDGQILPAQ
ncbi:MAG: cohesin domain-containing protein [bacterium]|nr:cohesin domain-containing protein [bacterium]